MRYDAVRARRDPLPHLQQQFPFGLQDIIEGRRPASPLHVEIHPHHSTTEFCNNNCAGCTGSHYRTLPGAVGAGIDPERLLKTIQDFKDTPCKEVVFSGNCTEPLLYPWIVPAISACRSASLKFSLYSNFYYGDKTGVIDELTSKKAVNDYVRISLDAGSEESYRKTHSPADPFAYSRIVANIERLVEAKNRRNPNLFIHVTYLLSNHNSADAELNATVNWAASLEGINCMRVTTYQKPLGREMKDASFIEDADLDRVKALLAGLKARHDREDFTLMPMFDEMDREQKDKPFRRCYVQDVFGVIGFDGGVYPCTAMAYADSPAHLRFGNINTEDFWDIWARKNAGTGNYPLGSCYDCTRAERNINVAIEGERGKKTVV